MRVKALIQFSAVILAIELVGLFVFFNQLKLFDPNNILQGEIMIFLGYGIMLVASLVTTALVLGFSILYLKLRNELTKESSK